ncbi:MAG: GIY-YIG nuclease family protein [Patescibacteria group bacterium]
MINQLPDNIPRTPGVYFFKNAKGAIVYIGKALNLRNRLRQHPMLTRADKLEWQEVGSEIEALILESQWIKRYKPYYNISLRDDKNYVYVQFTDEEFPKVFVTHRNGIGPFTSSTELRAALKAIRKLIPYCTCKQKHNRPCLNAHIGKCIGDCCLKNPKPVYKQYQKNIKLIKDIFSGKKKALKSFPRVFENIRVIKEIAGRESAVVELENTFKLKNIKRIEGYDISNVQGKFATGSMVVFENGYPNKSEYRKFKINPTASAEALAKADDTKMLDEMLARRFSHHDWPRPDVILIDGGIAQFNIAQKYFSPVLSIAKGKQEIFSSTLPEPLAISYLPSAVAHLLQHIDAEAHRFAITYYRKLHKKTLSGSMKTHV